MEFDQGFVIERPPLLVPWEITERELIDLLGADALKHVTRGYYTTACVALGGLSIQLGFHFEPRSDGRLHEFEVFRSEAKNLSESFAEFQAHLVAILGAPTITEPARPNWFPAHEWRFSTFTAIHSVMERFGPEEHVGFRR